MAHVSNETAHEMRNRPPEGRPVQNSMDKGILLRKKSRMRSPILELKPKMLPVAYLEPIFRKVLKQKWMKLWNSKRNILIFKVAHSPYNL